MANLNKCQLIGRLTADPVLKFVQSGASIVSFTVATNRYSQDSNGQRRSTADYTDCVVWSGAESKMAGTLMKHLAKGSAVYCEGRLQTRTWEGQDGQKHRTTEVVCHDVQFLSRAPDAESEAPRELAGVEWR